MAENGIGRRGELPKAEAVVDGDGGVGSQLKITDSLDPLDCCLAIGEGNAKVADQGRSAEASLYSGVNLDDDPESVGTS
jgi:hypothetical protein